MDFKNIKNGVIDVTGKMTDRIGSTVKGIKNGVGNTIDTVTNLSNDIKHIKSTNEKIKNILEETNETVEPIREETNEKLKELGKVKINIANTILEDFTNHMNEIKNIPFNSTTETFSANENFNFSKKELDDLEVSVLSVKKILKNSAGAGATGAISAGAIYSAVAAFGTASTGTLIGSISGAAATNATLAWLGGGALAAGGGGMALGTVVLGGITIVPAIAYLAWKGKFNYLQEREMVDRNYQEAIEYAQNMERINKNFKELIRLIDNTILLINRFSIECNKLNKQTEHIKNKIGLNYEKYTDEQKKLVKKQIVYTTKLLELINTPVMNENGSFNSEMIDILKNSNQFLNEADEIHFISFKKRNSIWTYIVPVVFVFAISSYIYYKYYFN